MKIPSNNAKEPVDKLKSQKTPQKDSNGDFEKTHVNGDKPGDKKNKDKSVKKHVEQAIPTKLDSDTVENDTASNGIDSTRKTESTLKEESRNNLKDENKSSTNDETLVAESILCTKTQPWSYQIEFDFIAITLFLIALVTRMWRIDEPRSIVFDELHYGKFASLYMKRIFFFDSHPPLGKQLIALAGYFAGFDGNTQFERIGGSYGSNFPIKALRSIPALFGSLLVPIVYHLLKELGLTHRTAAIAGVLIIIDNALLTQSRFILMESMLLFFSTTSILMLLKFRKYSDRPFSKDWWLMLSFTALSFSCAICVKYVGFFTALLVLFVIAFDYWKMIGNKTLSNKLLWVHLSARVLVLCVLPIVVYFTTFYIHLSILTKAGPHDNVMTSAFQASLEGGLASITKGQPLEIVHGSQITLRHTHGRACWLHSHAHVYPIKYADKRGSSHQQQVTCYSFKDVNNWWIVKRPDKNDLVVSEPIDRIKHGDIVQLIHGITSRALNSHDVAAPVSPQHQEVSCYIDYNISFPAQNLWRVEIANKDTEGEVWHTIHSHVRLVHVNSSQAMKFSGKQLPEWGFNQHEVVTDRVLKQDETVWNVEEHRHTKNSDQKEREREMGMAEFVPLQPTQLSFLEKFWELQYKMLTVNQENVQDHMYSSDPLEWFLMNRGIAYWISPSSNAQIHLLGNIVVWQTAAASLFLYLILLAFYLARRQRRCYDIPLPVWEQFCTIGLVFFAGYILHLIPFLVADRTLFLHHYLPAYIYKIFLLVAVLQHLDFLVCNLIKSLILKTIFSAILVSWLASAVYVYLKFSVLSYGTTPLSAQDIQELRWKPTWDLIIHRP